MRSPSRSACSTRLRHPPLRWAFAGEEYVRASFEKRVDWRRSRQRTKLAERRPETVRFVRQVEIPSRPASCRCSPRAERVDTNGQLDGISDNSGRKRGETVSRGPPPPPGGGADRGRFGQPRRRSGLEFMPGRRTSGGGRSHGETPLFRAFAPPSPALRGEHVPGKRSRKVCSICGQGSLTLLLESQHGPAVDVVAGRPMMDAGTCRGRKTRST